MSIEKLEKELRIAESRVAARREELRAINEKIVEAQHTLDSADAKRAQHAHAAATGDEGAKAAMANIRKECASAEQGLADLRLAIPEGQRRIVAAEQIERTARLALNKAQSDILIRKRVAAGRKVDASWTELTSATAEFDALSGDLEQLYVQMLAARGISWGVTNVEALSGIRRYLAAMPKALIRRCFPTVVLPEHQVPLAESEASFWNLPAGKTDEAA